MRISGVNAGAGRVLAEGRGGAEEVARLQRGEELLRVGEEAALREAALRLLVAALQLGLPRSAPHAVKRHGARGILDDQPWRHIERAGEDRAIVGVEGRARSVARLSKKPQESESTVRAGTEPGSAATIYVYLRATDAC